MRISDWSSDVCSSDLQRLDALIPDFVANGPSQDEVDRAVTSVVANRIKGLEQVGGFGGKAVALAEGALYANDPGFYKKQLAGYAEVTPASVQADRKSTRLNSSH